MASAYKFEKEIEEINNLASYQYDITVENSRMLIRKLATLLFRATCLSAGIDGQSITKLTTKFRDAGRRYSPWKAASSRAQEGLQTEDDGNRINRWLLDPAHKFYADEVTATLVECKYILQTLSMLNAPELINDNLKHSFTWLLGLM